MFISKKRKRYKELKEYSEKLSIFLREKNEETEDLSKWMNYILQEQINQLNHHSLSLKIKIEKLEYRIECIKNNFPNSYEDFIKRENRKNKIDNLLWVGQ